MYYLASRNLCSRDLILVYRYIKKERKNKKNKTRTYIPGFIPGMGIEFISSVYDLAL